MEDLRAERDQQQSSSKGEVREGLKQALSTEHAPLDMLELLTSSDMTQALRSWPIRGREKPVDGGRELT